LNLKKLFGFALRKYSKGNYHFSQPTVGDLSLWELLLIYSKRNSPGLLLFLGLPDDEVLKQLKFLGRFKNEIHKLRMVIVTKEPINEWRIREFSELNFVLRSDIKSPSLLHSIVNPGESIFILIERDLGIDILTESITQHGESLVFVRLSRNITDALILERTLVSLYQEKFLITRYNLDTYAFKIA